MNKIEVRKQINSEILSERKKICKHSHTPYRASYGMPCTGPLRCSMCNMEFKNHEERNKARKIAEMAENNIANL